MNITISTHAALQAAARGITEYGIRAIIVAEPAIMVTSKTDPEAAIMYGVYMDKIWAIIINLNTSNVITVRRARKNEVKFYEKEKRN
jgi:uncharacterized DUF497 family protein